MNVRFVSRNHHKIEEAQKILAAKGIGVIPSKRVIEEIQTADVQRLVRDKILKAYSLVGRPLFVEHTSLNLAHLQGLPGGLTQVFWDSLEAAKFSELFGKLSPNPAVLARTVVAFCDGRKIWTFEGEIAGRIVPSPRGPTDFQWDCVFQPDGHSETFAEMGAKKNDISMRKIALEKLASHLATAPI
jgi:XTP/dITP diphosphohydrolase